jgi:hypothetical protein
MAFLRVVQFVGNINPHRVIFLTKIIRQIWPWHQIEPRELHAILLNEHSSAFEYQRIYQYVVYPAITGKGWSISPPACL